jgi:hypothetical protein
MTYLLENANIKNNGTNYGGFSSHERTEKVDDEAPVMQVTGLKWH